MTFKQLLKTKDEALARWEECAIRFDEATAALESARAAHAEAGEALAAAHRSIRERLKDRGHHQTIDDHGTVTVFHATDEEDGPGWKSYHPIPGDE